MTERRIVDYIVARRDDSGGMLSDTVQLYIKQGYEPFGSIALDEMGIFHQPMVRYAEPEPTPDDELAKREGGEA